MSLFKALFVVFFIRGLEAQSPAEYGPSVKIVGGQQAAPGAYPFMAYIRNRNQLTVCGGTIIAPKYILTAAHCLEPTDDASKLWVYVGNTINTAGTMYYGSKIIIHPNYNRPTLINDIALIKLNSTIQMSTTVSAVTRRSCLDDNNSVHSVTAVGWGHTVTNGNISSQLQYVNLQTKTITDCKKYWGDFGVNQICTHYQSKGVCNGDSGGPLLYGGQQIGISSYVEKGGCATIYPDVYTKVCNYASWISSNAI